jgi:hypothetical protein
MHQRQFVFSAVTLALVLGVSAGLFAQVNVGGIDGRVTDQTGAVLPGAIVTITSPALLAPQTATTGETGAYRFAQLPIGTYTVTFELPNFRTVVRDGVILTAGATATINAELGLAEVAETVTVSSASPVVDVRSTDVTETFSQARLEDIPTSRDPWVIVEQAPGIVMDRQNVGGNESGQQSQWSTRGTPSSQNIWYYDGVDISDMAAAGASPMYYDFNAFQEINVSTGGQDANMQTAGTYLNFVVKQGSNDPHGQASYYFTNSDLQSDNITQALRDEGAGAGAPIKKIKDYGFDLGGPVLKDRLWLWGDYGVQDISRGSVGFFIPGCNDPNSADCLQPDPTFLRNNNIKANAQLTENNRFNFLWARNEKTRATRGAADTRPLDTTWRQGGPTNIYKFEDSHIFNPNFLMTGRFAYVSGGFFLDYHEDSLRDVQASYDYATGGYGRSFLGFSTNRPQYVANADGNYFVSNALGGDHEFKFGFQYKHSPVDSFTTYGGDVWAVSDGGQGVEAWFYRPSAKSYEGNFVSLHVQDVYTRGRATAKLGVRFDHQNGKNVASTIPANTVIPNLMPAVDFGGDSESLTWNNVSPRLGFTYDLSGDGRTVAKANYALYYDSLNLYYQVSLTNPAGTSEMDLPWTDLNGDQFVQANEVDTSYILYTANFDPNNPGAAVSPNQRDPNFSAPKTHELILGIDHELMPDLALRANYIYKRFTNTFWTEWPYSGSGGRAGLAGIQYPLVGLTRDNFVPVTTDYNGQTLTYYELAPGSSKSGDLYTNRPDYHQRFQGFEVGISKRLSNRWMLNASYTFGDQREYFDAPDALQDPTNGGIRDGGQIANYSAGSGKNRFFLNSRWVFKLDGLVQLPGEVNLGGSLNGRQGYPFIETFRTDTRAGGIGRTEIMLSDVGSTRLDNLWVANFRVEKAFTIGSTRASAMLDIFNLANSGTILKREQRQNLDTANNIQDLLSPRVFRIGVRFRF